MISFFKGKRIFITGHTGFKGSYLSKVLTMAGAEVCGLSKKEYSKDILLFESLELQDEMISHLIDIRNREDVIKAVTEFQPEIIFHLAAQPIVRESYKNPAYTYETNVMGTVNLFEAIRQCNSVRSVVNITTDKVYENKEWEWGYRENEVLNGFDPYSNSKSCSELITSSYKNSFFKDSTAISTARAGNVIGGGDFSKDRIIPDCVRAAIKNEDIIVRNPMSVRPYQHVFEAINAYLIIAKCQYENSSFQGSYNIGPNEEDCICTKDIVEIFCKKWGQVEWKHLNKEEEMHEANYLKLDCSKIKNVLGWKPKLGIEGAIELTVEWTKNYYQGKSINKFTEQLISEYFEFN